MDFLGIPFRSHDHSYIISYNLFFSIKIRQNSQIKQKKLLLLRSVFALVHLKHGCRLSYFTNIKKVAKKY